MDNQSATPESLVTSPAATTTTPPSAPHAGSPTPSMHLNPLPPLPGMPGSSSPFGSGRSGGGGGPLMLILVVILGLGATVFAVMALTFYSSATKSSQNLQAKESAAAEQAKAAQKKVDDEAYRVAGESPFRSYVAPVQFGSFEVKFPKDWSGYIDQENTGTQVSLVLNPDFVRRTNSSDELAATRVQLLERTSDQYMIAFSSYVKRGTLKQNNITVSGQQAFDLTGEFQDKKTSREVVVPVRDKVLVFINENNKYASEFNEILAQSKIVP